MSPVKGWVAGPSAHARKGTHQHSESEGPPSVPSTPPLGEASSSTRLGSYEVVTPKRARMGSACPSNGEG